MPKIHVPDRHRPGLTALAKMSEASVASLAAKLDQEMPTGTKILAAQLESVGVNASESAAAADALFSLHVTRSAFDRPAHQFAEEVSEALEEDCPGLPREQLAASFVRLLEIEPMWVQGKVTELLGRDERTFCGARIITDIRPVFGESVTKAPVGLALVHSLQIEVHGASGDRETLCVSLTTPDLDSLLRVLRRAQEKAETLALAFKGWGARLLVPWEDLR